MEKLTFTTLYDQLAPQWDRRFPANLARLRCLVDSSAWGCGDRFCMGWSG